MAKSIWGTTSTWTAKPRRLARSGGDEGTRTLNPCLAKAVLCQLSYVPETDSRFRPP
jgi:hypothetical protein